jgi:hypothetical protein
MRNIYRISQAVVLIQLAFESLTIILQSCIIMMVKLIIFNLLLWDIYRGAFI